MPKVLQDIIQDSDENIWASIRDLGGLMKNGMSSNNIYFVEILNCLICIVCLHFYKDTISFNVLLN